MSFYGRSIPKSNAVKPAPSDQIVSPSESCLICTEALIPTTNFVTRDLEVKREWVCGAGDHLRLWKLEG